MSIIPGAFLVVVATATVAIGAKVSAAREEQNLDEDEFVEINYTQAILMPLLSSVSLLVLFFFFDYAQIALLLISSAGAAFILFDLCSTAIKSARPALDWRINFSVTALVTLLVFVQWLNSNYVAHNILGCAMCITLISIMRFPSLKVAVLSLCLLVAYDIFWVFYSEYFFQANVMTSVATRKASNPVQSFGNHYNIDVLKQLNPTLELPMKIMVPSGDHYSMLGLGDIALPGLLVALALRSDTLFKSNAMAQLDDLKTDSGDIESYGLLGKLSRSTKLQSADTLLFEFSMVGYFLGLIVAFVVNRITQHAQPALIYLVPGVLVPLIGRAYHQGKLGEVWAGPKKAEAKS